MLKLAFILGVGTDFSRLAKKYHKKPWIFGVIVGVLAMLFMGVVSVVWSKLDPKL
jgi:Kef-type K+ transport system membrane component KefB